MITIDQASENCTVIRDGHEPYVHVYIRDMPAFRGTMKEEDLRNAIMAAVSMPNAEALVTEAKVSLGLDESKLIEHLLTMTPEHVPACVCAVRILTAYFQAIRSANIELTEHADYRGGN